MQEKQSCRTLLKITEDIRQHVDNSNVTLSTLLNFTEAFGLVNHEILCGKLENRLQFIQYYVTVNKNIPSRIGPNDDRDGIHQTACGQPAIH